MKNPVIGNVKTRLGNLLGDDAALDIYQELVHETRQLALQFEYTKYLYYSDYIDFKDPWSNIIFQKRIQKGEDLGKRMANAFKDICRFHSHTVIIGVDCPFITISHLHYAFNALHRNNVVIGPAQDGGYYLLGMKKFHPQLFKEIHWSSSKVLKQTLQRAADQDLSVDQMEILSDIDTPADWDKWLEYKNRNTLSS